ncbi:hypothetical protein AKJ43_01260 [candidate division MSBL1 archaeon SCGC-AAA261D19]|nr:hypothetical protein AKJ43_01260 [candidate division MSBL1 archaeon SCGC-AAA261D19]
MNPQIVVVDPEFVRDIRALVPFNDVSILVDVHWVLNAAFSDALLEGPVLLFFQRGHNLELVRLDLRNRDVPSCFSFPRHPIASPRVGEKPFLCKDRQGGFTVRKSCSQKGDGQLKLRNELCFSARRKRRI